MGSSKRRKAPTMRDLKENRPPKGPKHPRKHRGPVEIRKYVSWIVWILAVVPPVLSVIWWLTGMRLTEPFWTARIRFPGFPFIGNFFADLWRNAAARMRRGIWPPDFGSFARLFNSASLGFADAVCCMVLAFAWMIRVILRRQVFEKASSVRQILEIPLAILLILLVLTINFQRNADRYDPLLGSVFEIGAAALLLTGVIQFALLRRHRQKLHHPTLITGLTVEILLLGLGLFVFK